MAPAAQAPELDPQDQSDSDHIVGGRKDLRDHKDDRDKD
jgi:hypothetical protein